MEYTEDFYKNLDKYLYRRTYQLINHEEVYKDFRFTKFIEWDVARLETVIAKLCNQIIEVNNLEDLDDLKNEAYDIMFGQIDGIATDLMARCDTTKELSNILEYK